MRPEYLDKECVDDLFDLETASKSTSERPGGRDRDWSCKTPGTSASATCAGPSVMRSVSLFLDQHPEESMMRLRVCSENERFGTTERP